MSITPGIPQTEIWGHKRSETNVYIRPILLYHNPVIFIRRVLILEGIGSRCPSFPKQKCLYHTCTDPDGLNLAGAKASDGRTTDKAYFAWYTIEKEEHYGENMQMD